MFFRARRPARVKRRVHVFGFERLEPRAAPGDMLGLFAIGALLDARDRRSLLAEAWESDPNPSDYSAEDAFETKLSRLWLSATGQGGGDGMPGRSGVDNGGTLQATVDVGWWLRFLDRTEERDSLGQTFPTTTRPTWATVGVSSRGVTRWT